jgi:hypothetical protein
MERDPNQSWLDDVNMQLGLSHPYPTPPISILEQQKISLPVQPMSFGHGNVDYNASYGIPP